MKLGRCSLAKINKYARACAGYPEMFSIGGGRWDLFSVPRSKYLVHPIGWARRRTPHGNQER
jgi:hypothetical protein